MNRAALDKIIEAVEPLIAPLGYECLDVYWLQDRTLQIFIDRLDGKEVGLDDCVNVNKALDENEHLDDLLDGSYSLEVSSPGLARPLRNKAHFAKHLGQIVEVKLEEKVLERMHGKGKVIAVSDSGEVTLETMRGEWRFPLRSLQRASLVEER